MGEIFKLINQAGPSDASILISGESGTGKELVAAALHDSSERREKPYIRLNCAAIPDGLMESEMFGHEKGAFTGAMADRKGRFELAHGGTLFLDEVGEIPLALQSKLLRVLQEGEFERLGSSQTRHTNARIIAATNRDLETEVEEKRFREDLFYRINVFTITLPPLRNRLSSLPQLVDHFLNHAASRLNKNIHKIDSCLIFFKKIVSNNVLKHAGPF